jgi:hypothetical protein
MNSRAGWASAARLSSQFRADECLCLKKVVPPFSHQIGLLLRYATAMQVDCRFANPFFRHLADGTKGVFV